MDRDFQYLEIWCHFFFIPKEEYYKHLENLKKGYQSLKNEITSPVVQYYIFKKFEVLMCGDVEKLIKRRKTQDKQAVYYAIMEDKHDIISRDHITTDHGGRDRMLKHLCQKYANSTTEVVELYKSYCLVCQKKWKHPRGVVVNLTLWMPWFVMNHYELRIRDTENPCPWMYCPMT